MSINIGKSKSSICGVKCGLFLQIFRNSEAEKKWIPCIALNVMGVRIKDKYRFLGLQKLRCSNFWEILR